MFRLALQIQIATMVDSKLETTRVFWRKKFYNATDEQAYDPRPFLDVLSDKPEPLESANTGEEKQIAPNRIP